MQLNDMLLHLSLIDGVGSSSIQRIIEYMPKNMQLSDLYKLYISDFITQFGFSEAIATILVAGLKDTRLLDQERELIAKHAIGIVTILDDEYPSLLKSINVPPAVLYYRGLLPQDSYKALAVVGARKANFYGFDALKSLIPELVNNNMVIISGGAVGIDSVAHEQTVRAGGKTVAVLGSGLLEIYPASNRNLFESIVASGGAIMSSFHLRAVANPGHFPARNRIISGLSHGCIVVQAAQKSGALITARYALDQGREVFAIPGPIDSPLSAGCHALIKEGAVLVTSAQDIMNGFEFQISPQRCIVQKSAFKQTEIPAELALQQDDQSDSPENRIKHHCNSPQSLDDLIGLTGLDLEDLHGHLFNLQLQGKIQQDFMGLWQRI